MKPGLVPGFCAFDCLVLILCSKLVRPIYASGCDGMHVPNADNALHMIAPNHELSWRI